MTWFTLHTLYKNILPVQTRTFLCYANYYIYFPPVFFPFTISVNSRWPHSSELHPI